MGPDSQLEDDLRRHLDAPRVSSKATDDAELAGLQARVRGAERRMIERVKHLKPELDVVPFVLAPRRVLENRKVQVLVVRIVDVAKRAWSVADGKRSRHAEDVGVEPQLVIRR